MSNVNLNDLKIRVLQLKSVGYDKLIIQNELQEKLNKVQQELVLISQEIIAVIKMIESSQSEQSIIPPESDPVDPKLVVPIGNKLPPAPMISVSKNPPTEQKINNTHNIGRRA